MGDLFGAAAFPEGVAGALEERKPPSPSPPPSAAAPALRVPQQTPLSRRPSSEGAGTSTTPEACDPAEPPSPPSSTHQPSPPADPAQQPQPSPLPQAARSLRNRPCSHDVPRLLPQSQPNTARRHHPRRLESRHQRTFRVPSSAQELRRFASQHQNHLSDSFGFKCDGVRRHLREHLSCCLVVSAALFIASVPFN
jgi:hypothetical protein